MTTIDDTPWPPGAGYAPATMPAAHTPRIEQVVPASQLSSDVVVRADQVIKHAAGGHEAHRKGIPAGVPMGDLKLHAGDTSTTDATRAIPAAVDGVRDRFETLDADVADTRAAAVRIDTSDTNSLLAAAAITRRAEREIGAVQGPRVVSTAQHLIDAAQTPAELAAIASELPSLLAAQRAPADWVDAAVDAAAAKLVPGLAAKVAARDKAAKGLAITQANAKTVLRSCAQNTPVPRLVDISPYLD